MGRAKIVLCAAIAAVLLVGILVPAVAETGSYSCTRTETYRCLHTETYACTETESYWCSKTRHVYRCHTAQVCTTRTERVCSWNPYLYTNVCRDVEQRVCQPERRCRWETETYRDRCTREVDATCTREVTGTCTRVVPRTPCICRCPQCASLALLPMIGGDRNPFAGIHNAAISRKACNRALGFAEAAIFHREQGANCAPTQHVCVSGAPGIACCDSEPG